MAGQCSSGSIKFVIIVCSIQLAYAINFRYKHVENNNFQTNEQQNQLVNVMFQDKLEPHRKVQPPGILTNHGK